MNLQTLKKEAAKYGADVTVHPSGVNGGKLFCVDLVPENGVVWSVNGVFTICSESAPESSIPHSQIIKDLIERINEGTGAKPEDQADSRPIGENNMKIEILNSWIELPCSGIQVYPMDEANTKAIQDKINEYIPFGYKRFYLTRDTRTLHICR